MTNPIATRASALELQHKGGKWLAAAREYLKWNVNGGDRCTWGSEDRLPITVKQIEELGSYVAAAAINEVQDKPVKIKPSQRLLIKDRELDETGWEPTTEPWIVCAANRYGDYILVGARHWDNIMRATTELMGGGDFSAGWDILMSMVPDGGREQQGFIDQFGRFYTREEAEQVAQQNNQIMLDQRGGRLSENALHSEDLY